MCVTLQENSSEGVALVTQRRGLGGVGEGAVEPREEQVQRSWGRKELGTFWEDQPAWPESREERPEGQQRLRLAGLVEVILTPGAAESHFWAPS